jgi:S-disulfanyl-L-cysteine oxidoreductase SoxD
MERKPSFKADAWIKRATVNRLGRRSSRLGALTRAITITGSSVGGLGVTDACETIMSKVVLVSVITALMAGCVMQSRIAHESVDRLTVGQAATTEDITSWDIDIGPHGEGLPPGRGTVSQGAMIYAAKCAKCHGPTGSEGPMDRLVGGRQTLSTSSPVKTVGSYWPYATTLYDYIHRAMPFDAPQSLTADEVYAVTAWLLHQNGIIPQDAVMDSISLPAIQMPNRHGFVPDPRPDVPSP